MNHYLAMFRVMYHVRLYAPVLKMYCHVPLHFDSNEDIDVSSVVSEGLSESTH
jgi:hypothetical protein